MDAPGKRIATVPLGGNGSVASDLPCSSCEANLRGRDLEGTCPECGAPVAQSVPTIPLDIDGRIAGNVPCLRCAYNLRGLDPTGACPECGTPVPLSTQRRLLRFAPPGWVRRLAWGALLLAAGIGLALLLLATATGLDRLFGPTALAVRMMSAIGGHVALVPVVLAAAGIFFISSPDPSRLYSRESWTARHVLRHCLWSIPLLVVLAVNLPGGGRGIARIAWQLVIMQLTVLAAILVLVLALTRHLAALLRRIPRTGLCNQAKMLTWGILAVGVLALAYQAASLIPAPRSWIWVFGAYRGAGALLQVAWTALALWMLILLMLTQRQLALLAKEAEASGATQPVACDGSTTDDSVRE